MFNLNEGLLAYLVRDAEAYTKEYYLWYFVFALISITCAYLLGSINSAIIVSKSIYRDDVRKHGSGNPGLTNMLRTYGKGGAGLTLLGDMLKTAVAIFISGIFFGFNYVGGVSTGEGFCYIAGLFAVIGHVFPIYYKFKGGKGVLSTATMVLILTPGPFAILFLIFAAVVAMSKYVSLGSVVSAVLYPVVLHGYFMFIFSNTNKSLPGLAALASIIIAILVVWCHRGNLQRISDRTERKLSFKKAPKDDGESDESKS